MHGYKPKEVESSEYDAQSAPTAIIDQCLLTAADTHPVSIILPIVFSTRSPPSICPNCWCRCRVDRPINAASPVQRTSGRSIVDDLMPSVCGAGDWRLLRINCAANGFNPAVRMKRSHSVSSCRRALPVSTTACLEIAAATHFAKSSMPPGTYLISTSDGSPSARASDSKSSSNTVSNLVATLVPVLVVTFIYLVLFLIFRRKFKRNYQPRSVLSSFRPEQRSPQMSDSLVGWVKDFLAIKDEYVLQHHSMDAYLFLRFLKVILICLFVGCCITWPILFPINATAGGGASQLDIISYVNVANATDTTQYWRFWAHAVCAIIYFGFLMYMITRESVFYINLRQAYLLSPLYGSRISSRTVLFTSVPEDYMNEGKLRRMFGPEARRVWFATDTEELEDIVDRRDKAAMKLEAAETKLIKQANANRLKAQKKGAKDNTERVEQEEAAVGEGSGSQWLDTKNRPTHKLKFLGLCGTKVDTIDWCRSELEHLIPEVNKAQAEHKNQKAKMLNSVFIEFDSIFAAQAAYQMVAHHQALHMAPRFAGVRPAEIIWSNLRIKWWERVIRRIVGLAIVVALVMLWTIPVLAVGSFSNIQQLEQTKYFTWLSFLQKLPKPLQGLVSGLLPVILLAVVMMLPPIILRATAKMSGCPTRSAVELFTQNGFFAFQVVQVFFFATIGSAIPAVAGKIAKDPTSAPGLLAANIPKAYTLFLSYFVLQGLTVVSGLLLGLVGLLLFKLLGMFLDTTPRKMYKRWIGLAGLGWGTIFPIFNGFFVIATCYSVIAPLVMGFAFIGISLFYVAYKYNMLFVYDADVDTKGAVYPRALQQIFVGLYVAEVCYIGLFAVSAAKGIGAVGPVILMVILLIFTALYNISLNTALGPLIDHLPRSLEAEERHLLAAEKGEPIDGPSNGFDDKDAPVSNDTTVVPKEKKKANMFTKFLRPDIHCDYATMRELVPKNIAVHYTEAEEEGAYFNPAITSETPLLWIPRDEMGISRTEVHDTSKIIPITDEGAYFNEKNKIVWDADDAQPPIYTPTPHY